MATAHEDVASGGRRRNLGLGTVFCFGSRRESGQDQEASPSAEGTTTPWEWPRRRKKRTVPVDSDLASGTAADSKLLRRRSGSGTHEEESRKRKGLRLPRCCFFLAPGREHSAMDSSRRKQRHPERTEHPPSESNKNNSLSEASKIQATGGSTSTSNGGCSRGAEQPRGAAAETTTRVLTRPCGSAGSSKAGAGVGAFGHVVGLSVVVAVSMAGLLGGRLWAVACVCAWLAALSRLRQREAAVDDVDSAENKEPVLLRVL